MKYAFAFFVVFSCVALNCILNLNKEINQTINGFENGKNNSIIKCIRLIESYGFGEPTKSCGFLSFKNNKSQISSITLKGEICECASVSNLLSEQSEQNTYFNDYSNDRKRKRRIY